MEGVSAAVAVKKGASWKGTFDNSEIRDGMTLTISSVTFEFDNDGTINNAGNIQVQNGLNGLQAAIMGSSLAGTFKNCTVTNAGGDRYELLLEQDDAFAVENKGIGVELEAPFQK